MPTAASFVVSCCWLYLWPMVIRHWRATQRNSDKLWVGMMIFALALFQIFQYYLMWFDTNTFFRAFYTNSGTSLLFPLSLAIILQLYLSGSSRVFRYVCLTLLVTNAAAGGFACYMRAGWWPAPLLQGYEQLWTNVAIGKIVFGTIILFIDILVIIVCVKWTRDNINMKWRWSRIASPLLIALGVDSILFSLVVHLYDSSSVYDISFYWNVLIAQSITKLWTGAIYAGCLTLAFRGPDRETLEREPEPAKEFLKKALPLWVRRIFIGMSIGWTFPNDPSPPYMDTGVTLHNGRSNGVASGLTGNLLSDTYPAIMEDQKDKEDPLGSPALEAQESRRPRLSGVAPENVDDEAQKSGKNDEEELAQPGNMVSEFGAYLRDLPVLIGEQHEGHQAAYYRGRRISLAATKREILTKLESDPEFKDKIENILVQRIKSRDIEDFGRS